MELFVARTREEELIAREKIDQINIKSGNTKLKVYPCGSKNKVMCNIEYKVRDKNKQGMVLRQRIGLAKIMGMEPEGYYDV